MRIGYARVHHGQQLELQIASKAGTDRRHILEDRVTRKLAVILHRMWRDGTEFRWSNQKAAVAAT
jgi:hypothetical protein